MTPRELVRAIMNRENLTQSDVAKRTRQIQTTFQPKLSKWLRGGDAKTQETLIPLAHALGIDPGSLISDEAATKEAIKLGLEVPRKRSGIVTTQAREQEATPVPAPEGTRFMQQNAVPVLQWKDAMAVPVPNADARWTPNDWMPFVRETSARSKLLVVPDDALSPELLPGDYVHLEPDTKPRPKDIVLITDGETCYLRIYLQRPGGRFEAQALDPAYASMESERDGLRVLAVMVGMTRLRKR